ncbi:hypothetical protein EON79_15135, partial [bacterium]
MRLNDKIAYDLELFGYFTLNIVWSKDRTKIAEINYIQPWKVRYASESEIEGVQDFLISNDWTNTKKFPPKRYREFNQKDTKEPNQILYVKEYRPTLSDYYVQPYYISARYWIETSYEISVWHLSNIRNGFSPQLHINFVGPVPPPEKMKEFVSRLNKEFSGSRKAGGNAITFSGSKDTAPTITPIPLNSMDEKY